MQHSRQVGAVTVAVLSLGVALLGMAVWWEGPHDTGDWVWTLTVALVYGPAGVALIGRAPRLAVAFLAMALFAALALWSGEQAGAVAAGRSDHAGSAAVWLSSWTWVPPYLLLVAVVPNLLPDGRPLAGRMRWGYRIGVAAAAISSTGWLLTPYHELDEASAAALTLGVSNPVAVPGASIAIALGLTLALVGGLAGVLSLGVRWHRGHDRHRLTWVLAGITGTMAFMAAGLAVPGGSSVLMALAVIPLPAAVVIGAATTTARLETRLRLSEASLAVAHEEERRRLRHDLHDSLGPALAGVGLQLEALSADIGSNPERAAQTATCLADRVREAVKEVRRLVDGLGPEGALGLAEALRTEVETFDAPVLRATLQLDPDEVRGLPAAVEVATVRVVREALANAARHAAGDRCLVHVSRDGDQLLVRVRDNGIGISASLANGRRPRSGVGLSSMRAVAQQIGGSCAVNDAAGGGTEVRLVLPLVPA